MTHQNIENHWGVIKSSFVSEKATNAQEQRNLVTFIVDKKATKADIKKAVEKIFEVGVISVNTMNRKGKIKRNQSGKYHCSDVKFALVKIKKGKSIDFFAEN